MKFNDYEIKFGTNTYLADGSMFIEALIIENGNVVDYYGDITTCIPFATNDGEIILDTNNCGELITEMISQGLIEKTNRTVPSGYCIYPIGKVTKKFETELIA